MHCVQLIILLLFLTRNYHMSFAQFGEVNVHGKVMEDVYKEIKTPYKYRLEIAPSNDSLAFDSLSIFRNGNC